jgi:2-polyprenyl-3-methyl-5-hydroxy-6-metoxy-1,4-benzoquinol methylase
MTEKKHSNSIQRDLEIIGYGKTVHKYYDKTRDRKDIHVMQCIDSGALFLNRTDHIFSDYYECMENYDYYLEDELNDTGRRAELVNQYVKNKYLDIGTGRGEILSKIKSNKVDGLEPQSTKFAYRNLEEVKGQYDTVSMFHVLEHIPEQIEYLKNVAKIIKKGGYIIIEVPHARDNLIETCEAFRKHTFWSEHLILHTDKTLIDLLLHCGFDEVQIIYEQRYPLANTMYWHKYGKPGGHKHMTCDIISEGKNRNHLIKSRKSDTLIAIAKKP